MQYRIRSPQGGVMAPPLPSPRAEDPLVSGNDDDDELRNSSSKGRGLSGWFKRKVADPLRTMLKRGAEPKHLALSLALGADAGLFPIVGVTALLCLALAYCLRSRTHAPTMLIANMLVTPIEVSLALPLMKLGEFVCRAKPIPLSPSELWKALLENPSLALRGMMYAIIGWALVSPLILAGLYYTMLPLMVKLQKRFSSPALSPLVADMSDDERWSPARTPRPVPKSGRTASAEQRSTDSLSRISIEE
eukprot:jgi/Chlat1/233/Chrsp1S03044